MCLHCAEEIRGQRLEAGPWRDRACDVRRPPTEAMRGLLKRHRSGSPMQRNFRVDAFPLRNFP
jgi:hypothetical protein